MPFPEFDPVLIHLGPLAIRWYALAYIAGIALGWWYAGRLVKNAAVWAPNRPPITTVQLDDLALYIVLGIILGGRLGYALFYQPHLYGDLFTGADWGERLALFRLWDGGMSFHGGFLGVTIGILIFAARNRTPLLSLGDLVAPVVPIGLGFGRLANFINGELWGRTSDVAWAMVFPRGGPLPRHPSQLYQAFFEGIVLLTVILLVWRFTDGRRRPGLLCGVFFAGYGVARIVGELFREPDAHLGYLWGPLTMGMLLSVPLLAVGAWLISRAYAKPALP